MGAKFAYDEFRWAMLVGQKKLKMVGQHHTLRPKASFRGTSVHAGRGGPKHSGGSGTKNGWSQAKVKLKSR